MMYKLNSVYFDLIICSISINTYRRWEWKLKLHVIILLFIYASYAWHCKHRQWHKLDGANVAIVPPDNHKKLYAYCL